MNINYSLNAKKNWSRKETRYLGVIVGNGTLRTAPDKISVVRDWPLPETQNKIKSFVQVYSYYGKFIHHFSDCASPLTNLWRNKNLPGNVVHTKTTKSAFETHKSFMIFALAVLIPRMGMRLNLLLQLMLVQLALLVCFYKKTPLILKDHVLNGLRN